MDNAASNYSEVSLLNWVAGKVRPADVTTGRFLSLHTANPNETGASELSGSGYARKTCAASFTTLVAGESISNTATIVFAAASGNWSPAYYWGLWDAVTTGNFICGGWIPAGVTVLNGQVLTIAIGAITIRLT